MGKEYKEKIKLVLQRYSVTVPKSIVECKKNNTIFIYKYRSIFRV